MKPENGKQQILFEAWFAADREMRKAAESCGISERTGYAWAERFHWHARADARDQEAAKRAEKQAIARRASILADQAKAGELLRRRGVEYFAKNKVQDGREAIAAISKGVELERQSEQMPQHLLEILNYSEAELRAERERILRAAAAGFDRPPALGEGEAEPADDGEAGADGSDPVLPLPPAAEAGDIPGLELP